MAITVPAAGTKLSVSAFGKPVADQLNLNARVAWGRIGHATVTTAQNGITSALTDVAGLTVTFTARNDRYYDVTVGGIIVYAAGPGILDIVVADGANATYVKTTAGVPAAGFASYPNLTTPPLILAAGSVTMKARMAINAYSVNTSNGPGAPSYIVVRDIGPNP